LKKPSLQPRRGDTIIVDEGDYVEDITVDKAGIAMLNQLLRSVTIDGDITVTSEGCGFFLAGVHLADGRSVTVEDGVTLPSFSTGMADAEWIVFLSDGFRVRH